MMKLLGGTKEACKPSTWVLKEWTMVEKHLRLPWLSLPLLEPRRQTPRLWKLSLLDTEEELHGRTAPNKRVSFWVGREEV